MYQEIVGGSHQRPEQGELRADNALNVSPLVAVVPQTYVEEFQAAPAGDVLDDGHGDSHGTEQEHLVQHRIVCRVKGFQAGDEEENAQPAAVQRQIGPGTEAGVDPFALRIGIGKEASEEQLQHPSADGADEKEKGQG